MTRNEEFNRGYDAAKAGKANYRHSRWWIDDNGAELARPDVVKGIEQYNVEALQAEYRDEADTTAGLLQF